MKKINEVIKKQKKISGKYFYEGKLGIIYLNKITTFKLWSPTAKKVIINIYDKNNKMIKIKDFFPKKNKLGVWEYIEKEIDLDGFYYQYIVDDRKILDPYAVSIAEFKMNPNGEILEENLVAKGAIIDLTKTIKLENIDLKNFNGREDAIVYEVHIRDFTSEKDLKLNNLNGSYLSFIEKLDYIKELGVTHIQLLPVMKFYLNDESNKNMEYHWSTKGNNYNWGYDPYSYFSPEGVYASENKSPYTRINELKILIDEIHKKEMGVILDVVYTHMAKTDFLDDIVPNYYFFLNEKGEKIGGFGNNLATTESMAKKLMLDSIKYWFEEYKIDGMRFDMMGDCDSKTMEEAYVIAKQINPKVIFLGEGWRTFSASHYGVKGADQDWAKESSSVSHFSDDMRNILKSGFMKEGKPRFLTNGAINIRKLFKNIKAQPTNFIADEPGDTLQYIEAHDNLTLHDTIAIAMKYSTEKNQEDIHKRIRIGNFILATSQGAMFIHSGQEYGRSKEWKNKESDPEQKFHRYNFGTFIDDSYDSTDIINSFKWSMLDEEENKKTLEFMKNLIKLRKLEPKFRYKSKNEIDKNIKLLKVPEIKDKDLVIVYKNDKYLIIVNADNKPRELSLNMDLKNYLVIIDGIDFNIEGNLKSKNIEVRKENNKIVIKPLTTILMRRIEYINEKL